MFRWYITIIVTLTTYSLLLNGVKCNSTCFPSSGRELSVSIESRRNGTYEWLTTFGAERTTVGNQSDIQMEANHKYFECEGRTTVKIQGVIRELVKRFETAKSVTKSSPDFLRFHNRTGTNVMVTNNGTSMQKINTYKWDDSMAFTHRPLKDDELFEVMIISKDDVNGDAVGIGVIAHSPDTFRIPSHMFSMSGTWMLYERNILKDGKVKKLRMKNLKTIQVGERIGVKRTANGELHLFVNGVDQGVVAEDVPPEVYGVLDLFDSVTKVSIIDHKKQIVNSN